MAGASYGLPAPVGAMDGLSTAFETCVAGQWLALPCFAGDLEAIDGNEARKADDCSCT